MPPRRENVGRRDRLVIAVLWMLVFAFGGIAASATVSQALGDSGFTADGYAHDPSTIVSFYVLGLIDGVLTTLLLFWLLPRWWRGRERSTAQRAAPVIALGTLAVAWFSWFLCAAVLSVGS